MREENTRSTRRRRAAIASALGVLAFAVAFGGAQPARSAPAASSKAAVAGSQVFRALNTRTITGPVAGTGESVSANLGTTPKPVVLVWNADYNSTGRTFAAWKVNGGACRALGAGQLRTFAGPFELATVQGVALPSDGLVPGVNTFELCLGEIDPGASLGLGFRTIALRKGN